MVNLQRIGPVTAEDRGLDRDGGFPRQQAWWTIKRHGMAVDGADPLGLYLGTTTGQVWASFDEGENWQSLVLDLP